MPLIGIHAHMRPPWALRFPCTTSSRKFPGMCRNWQLQAVVHGLQGEGSSGLGLGRNWERPRNTMGSWRAQTSRAAAGLTGATSRMGFWVLDRTDQCSRRGARGGGQASCPRGTPPPPPLCSGVCSRKLARAAR